MPPVDRAASPGDEENQSAGEEKSLQDILSEAYDQHTEGEGAATEGAAAEGESQAQPTEGESRTRDPRGRFKGKEGAEGAEGKETKERQPAVEKTEAEKAADVEAAAAAAQSLETPEAKAARELDDRLTARWSPAQKEQFKKFAPDAQTFLRERFRGMESDYTKKMQGIADFRREYEPVHQLFVPFMPQMQKAGYTPQTLIKAWASVEQDLMSGDVDRQLGVIDRMVKMYKLDPQRIAAKLGITAAGATPGAAATDPARAAGVPEIPAAMAPWVQELAGVKDWISKSQARETEAAQQREREAEGQRNAEYQRIGNDIEQFRAATDKDGKSLLHPFFDEVEKDMSVLAQVARARGEKPNLAQLYETAVRVNPSVWAKKVAAEQSAQRQRTDAEARTRAANARRAGASVTGAPGSGTTPKARPANDLSLREQLDAAFDEHSTS